MDKKSGGLGIYGKIFLTMMSIALIPLLVIGAYNYLNEQEKTTARVNRQFEQVAKILDANVSGWVDANILALHQNAELADIRSGVAARQIPVLKSMVDVYTWTFLASTIGADGKNVARSDFQPPIDYGDREYFKQAMSGKDVGQQVVISKTTGAPALVLAAAFPTADGGKGVLMTSSALRDISEAITTTRIGRTGFTVLLDGKGHVIAHPVPDASGKLRDMSSHPAFKATRDAANARVTFSEDGKEYVAYATTTRLGWVIIVQQETREAFAPVKAAISDAALAVLSVAVVTLVAAYLLARGLSAPILRLTRIADAVSRGQTGGEIVEINRRDELGGLARAIDRMRVSIDMAMKRLRRGDGGPA
jgi:methyl-accepting chemotaxis protein